jgi:twitching motility protein PilT
MGSIHSEQKIKGLLRTVASQGASDLHLTVGRYPTLRIDGKLVPVNQGSFLTPADTRDIGDAIMNEKEKEKLIKNGHVDFSYNLENKARFRVNAFPIS